ncbi:MAG TPA: SdrD B-like domain-containing protein, partial [Bacteroidota bacterium]|nr:SdrD B-like domain-containing protein [Bacteroidota bacterium]
MLKKGTSFFVLAIAILFLANCQLFAQVDSTTSPNLPPPGGTYVSPDLYHQLYANGIIIKDVSHDRFNPSQPPPETTQTHSFSSEVHGMVSFDNGNTYNPINALADVMVQVTHTGDIGPTRLYDTEMLQLDIHGGSLPPTVMIRESPTLASRGKTHITDDGGGMWRIGSFFDIFTEMSTDGGANWSPSNGSTHMVLQGAPPPVVIAAGQNLPPLMHEYITPAQFHQLYAAGIVIKDIKHKYFTQNQPPPPPGGTQSHSFNSIVQMMVSNDSGNTFEPMTAPAAVEVMVHGDTGNGGATTKIFDTEMLSLNLSGGDLPAGLMIRESPTLPSRGGTSIRALADGTYEISSFFDVFTELSIDGGQSWMPAQNGSSRVELQPTAPPIVRPVPDLPPDTSHYVNPFDQVFTYTNGIMIRKVSHERFDTNQPPPPPGGNQTHSFNSTVRMEASTDAGNTWTPHEAPAAVSVHVGSMTDEGNSRFFETEMLQLDISGGTLGGVMIRESPTRASLGRTSIRSLPSGDYEISSFFDIFTEMSLDGGQSWSPTTTGPHYVEVHDIPPESVKICGVKWADLNGNGLHDADELGLAGWTIKITDGGGNVVTVTTDASGNYCVKVPAPGKYRVEESQQPGWMQTGGQSHYDFTTAPGQDINGIDFGNAKNGEIYGMKFNDHNGNGVKDPGDEGLPGWTICITRKPDPRPPTTFPTTGGTDFLGGTLASVNINLYPAYGGANITLCAFGNTTVQRANPSGPTPADSMLTEITLLDMIGTLPPPYPNDTFHIKHKTDRRSFG